MHALPGSLVNAFPNEAGVGRVVKLLQDRKKTEEEQKRDERNGRGEREKKREGKKEGRKEGGKEGRE